MERETATGREADDPWAAQRRAIGAYIRTQRNLADLSLREFARLTSLSNAYLSQLERGRHDPSVRVLTAIADALSVPVSRLLDPDAAEPSASREPPVAAGASDPGADAGSTTEAIRGDPALSAAEKDALLAVYRSFVARTADGRPFSA